MKYYNILHIPTGEIVYWNYNKADSTDYPAFCSEKNTKIFSWLVWNNEPLSEEQLNKLLKHEESQYWIELSAYGAVKKILMKKIQYEFCLIEVNNDKEE